MKLVFISLLFMASVGHALQIEIINHADKPKYNYRMGIFDSDSKFAEDIPVAAFNFKGEGHHSFEAPKLKAGKRYLIMVFDDIDGDKELKRKYFGIPVEPWGSPGIRRLKRPKLRTTGIIYRPNEVYQIHVDNY